MKMKRHKSTPPGTLILAVLNNDIRNLSDILYEKNQMVLDCQHHRNTMQRLSIQIETLKAFRKSVNTEWKYKHELGSFASDFTED